MQNTYHPMAESLNKDISSADNCVFDLLSQKGKSIYFPFKGILGQTAEAKSCAINATVGTAFEEDSSPLCLECVEEIVNLPSDAFLYAPSFGNQKLREIWKEHIYKKNPSLNGKKISLPIVTSALTHGLYLCGYLFADESDKIILPDLNWDNYELIFSNGFGSSFSYYPTFTDQGAFNVAGLEQSILKEPAGKKIILLNFPNNPTGYTPSNEEAYQIRNCLITAAEKGNKILAILDDAYFGLVYKDGIFKESLFAILAEAHPNILAVKLDGPTKEDYAWGFRVGFITFSAGNTNDAQLKALESKAAGVVRCTISNCSNLAQSILLKAYQNRDYEKQKEAKYQILKKRYEKLSEIFASHPEYADSFEVVPYNSGYFMCVKPIGVEPEEVRKLLISEYSTGVIVLSGLLRIAFSSVPLNKLGNLIENIHSAITKIKNKKTKNELQR